MVIKKGIIPAAGLGTRFLPATKAIPKPMLTVVDKPIIQYIAEEAVNSGIKELMIIISPDNDDIIKHFTPNESLEKRLEEEGKSSLLNLARSTACGANITFAVQKTANGLGDALLCAEEWLDGEPFALLLGDELIYTKEGEKPCIRQLADNYEKNGVSTLATMKVEPKDTVKYGNIKAEKFCDKYFHVTDMAEKPKESERFSDYAVIGRYVLSYDVIKYLKTATKEGGEIYLTDAFLRLIKDNGLDACLFDGIRFDAGDKAGYITANLYYGLLRSELKEDLTKSIKNIVK